MSDQPKPPSTVKRTERDHVRGLRSGLVNVLRHILGELGYEDRDATRARWVLERETAVEALGKLCAKYGDNDWDEHLDLADVVDKHLGRHLEEFRISHAALVINISDLHRENADLAARLAAAEERLKPRPS